jgi:hypothetical protein
MTPPDFDDDESSSAVPAPMSDTKVTGEITTAADASASG